MASWSSNASTIKFGNKDHLTPPSSSAADMVQEQYKVAAQAAELIRNSKVLGAGSIYTVNLSGTANPGHPNGDSITVTVTNAN